MSPSEAEAIETELAPPFTVARPEALKVPLVFNSPHSGRIYPKAFLAASRLDSLALRRSEDAYVEELFGFVTRLGAPLLYAHFPRAYLDVNREPYELDPVLFRDGLPHYANTQSVRVIGGLGTIARIVSESDEIYREPPLGRRLRSERINRLYTPYHETLATLLAEAQREFGLAVLIDCHSMPSRPHCPDQGAARPDFVLGDRFGTCLQRRADPALPRSSAQGAGLRGGRWNKPYAGGYITEHYGRPHKSHARPSDRDQPRPLYGRDELRKVGGVREAARRSRKPRSRHLFRASSGLAIPRAAAE